MQKVRYHASGEWYPRTGPTPVGIWTFSSEIEKHFYLDRERKVEWVIEEQEEHISETCARIIGTIV